MVHVITDNVYGMMRSACWLIQSVEFGSAVGENRKLVPDECGETLNPKRAQLCVSLVLQKDKDVIHGAEDSPETPFRSDPCSEYYEAPWGDGFDRSSGAKENFWTGASGLGAGS
jgi:hypothetical protein